MLKTFKILLILSIILSLTSNICFADEAVVLLKGATSPYDGILLPADKAQEVRRNKLELDIVKDINASLERSVLGLELKSEKKDQQINLLMEQNDKLATSAYKAQNMKDIEKVGYFVLGLLVYYGARQLP